MENNELIQSLKKQFEIELRPSISEDGLLLKLAEVINHLIQQDFEKLVSVLYKIDVSESKLKELLQQHLQEDAAPYIARLIIEREQQKIHSRNKFSKKNDIPDEEKW